MHGEKSATCKTELCKRWKNKGKITTTTCTTDFGSESCLIRSPTNNYRHLSGRNHEGEKHQLRPNSALTYQYL